MIIVIFLIPFFFQDWIEFYPFRALIVQLEMEEKDSYSLHTDIEKLRAVAYTTLNYSFKNIFEASVRDFTVTKYPHIEINLCHGVHHFIKRLENENIDLSLIHI